MEQELARQAGVDELDGEVVESATTQFTTQSLKPLISDETAILGGHHNKENLVLEEESNNGTHYPHQDDADDVGAQHVEMFPKRHGRGMWRVRSEEFSLFHFVLFVIRIDVFHAILEALHTLSQAFHQLGNLLSTKEQQHHQGDEQYF